MQEDPFVETRAELSKFYEHWSILVGGTLTLLMGFLTTLHATLTNELNILLRITLALMGFSLISAALRNFFTARVLAETIAHNSQSQKEMSLKMRLLGALSKYVGFASIFTYVFGMILLIKVVLSLFLS